MKLNNKKLTCVALFLLTMVSTINITNEVKSIKNKKDMITVKVTYGVKKEFVKKNKENIAVFLEDFKKMDTTYFRYNVYTLDDETSFVHISSYANEGIQQEVLNTPSFKEFQRQRDASGLIKAHHLEILHNVGSSGNY